MNELISRRRFISLLSAGVLAACTTPLSTEPGSLATPTSEAKGTPQSTAPLPVVNTRTPSTPPLSPTEGVPTRRQTSKPNIIFILTDDLDAQSMESMPQLKANLIDRGLKFTNSLYNFPLCCPCRTGILTGMCAHNSRIYGNSGEEGGYQKILEYGLEKNALPVWLQAAGYRTMLVGKYLNGYPGGKKKTHENPIPPGWSEWYASTGATSQGFNYTLNENGKTIAYGDKADEYATDVFSRKAQDFITRSTNQKQPFFFFISTNAPHSPSVPAPRHAKMFAEVKAPRLPSFNEEDISDKPWTLQALPKLTEQEIVKIDENYRLRLQSLQAVDEMIADLIQQVRKLGIEDSTYIFFASDNGYHLGQHRLPNGKAGIYEEDICVPLIVRGPGVPEGKSMNALVGNIDFAPTFAELAGAKVPVSVDGRSLVPLFKGSVPNTWRQAYLIERGALVAIPPMPTTKPAKLPKGATWSQGIRTAWYTYVEHTTGERELYDLKHDPYQLENIAAKTSRDFLQQLSERVAQLRRGKGSAFRSVEDLAVPVYT
ncbi:MAG TPA: sulfatase [Anaerolineaceae bacterium]